MSNVLDTIFKLNTYKFYIFLLLFYTRWTIYILLNATVNHSSSVSSSKTCVNFTNKNEYKVHLLGRANGIHECDGKEV